MFKIKILSLILILVTAFGLLSPYSAYSQSGNANDALDQPVLLADHCIEGVDPDCTHDPGTGEETEETPETCLSISFASAITFGWILCPIMSFLANLVQDMFEWTLGKSPIGGEKYCNLIVEFDDEGNSGCGTEFKRTNVQKTWNAFRTLANVFFALAFLYAIYQVAFASGNNAYLIKSMLPRLAAAAVLVQLSFFLSEILIIWSNEFGSYVDNVFNWVFTDEDEFSLGGIIFGDDDSFENIIFNKIALSGAVIFFIYSWATILAAIGLSLLVVLLVLVARKLLILLAIVLAPLAAIAWIHPQTDGFAKAWWQTFSKLLLMYPLIILLIRSGELMARASSGSGDSALFDLMRFIAFFAPFFLIPFTFRFAGGMIGQLAGVVDNQRKGLVDRARGVDERRRGYRREKARAQFKADELLGNKPNIITRTRAGLLGSRALYGRTGGKLYNAEQTAEAMAPDDKIGLYGLKAKKQSEEVADFKLQQETTSWTTKHNLGQDQIKEKLARIANGEDYDIVSKERVDSSSAEKSAALRQLMVLRAVPQLEAVMERAANGTDADRALIDRFKQDNFGTLDSFAAHLSRSSYEVEDGRMIMKPGYGALAEMNAEQLTQQKPYVIKGALAHAARQSNQGKQLTESADAQEVARGEKMIADSQAFVDSIMTTYSNAASHQRTEENTSTLLTAARNGTVEVPQFELSGARKVDAAGNKDSTIYVGVPASPTAVARLEETVGGNITPPRKTGEE